MLKGEAVTEAAFAALALLILGWAVASDLLLRVNLTGPLVMLVAGSSWATPTGEPAARVERHLGAA